MAMTDFSYVISNAWKGTFVSKIDDREIFSLTL